MQASGIQGLRSGAAAGSGRRAQHAALGVARLERRRMRASAHACPPATEDRPATAAHQTLTREAAQRSVGELRAGQEGLARLVAQLEAGGEGLAGADVFAGLQEVRGRLERVAADLRAAGQPCRESSSSSSSSEDECTGAEAAARAEAKRAAKAAKAADKAAKKEAKAAEKEAKRAAKIARRAEEALLLGPAAAQQPEPLFREEGPPLLVTAAAAPGPGPAPQPLEAGAGRGEAGAAAAPARGALVLRTLRGDLVLDGGASEAGRPAAPAAVRVEVCTGKACARRGAAALLEELGAALAGDAGVDVAGCKCMDQCKKGPNLRVRVAGQAPVVAVGVPPGDAGGMLRRVA